MTTRVRVYLPAVLADLELLVRTGALRPRAGGRAVTAALRLQEPDLSMDEWEFLAFSDATEDSLALLRQGERGSRRVVVSADVDPLIVQPADGTAVVVTGEIPRSAVAAVHVDDSASVEQVDLVLAGSPPTLVEDIVLEWYDPSEIDQLL